MDAVSEIWDILSIYLSGDTRKIATLKLSNLDWRTASLNQVKDLVKRGADVNAKNRFGETPLHRASNGGGGVENVKYLVEQGADVNAKDGFGTTPLHGAFSAGVAEYLIKHGADINAKDKDGNTPLHQACMHNISSVEYLVEQGADINAKDKKGNTPLHIAASWGRKEVVEYLVEQGADIRAKNEEGKIPFGLAAEGHHTEIVQYLDEHLTKEIDADAHAKDKGGNAPTMQSTPAEKMQGDLSVLKDVAKDEQTPEQVARTNEQIGNLSEAVLNNVNSMDVGVKEQDKAVLTQLAGKGYDKAAEELAKLEEQSKTSPLKTTLKDGEENGAPVSAPAAAKGEVYALSDEYTRGNDVSISIVNPALMKNKGR